MNIFKKRFLINKKPENNKALDNEVDDQYSDIAKSAVQNIISTV